MLAPDKPSGGIEGFPPRHQDRTDLDPGPAVPSEGSR
jgi:hypothetical protein